ncbi:MAG: sensor histidine kinase [Deltaproteobacteria bacterium]|nr:sensor histidine kinase [Deltaproteobacteria bacterium]
MADSFFSARQPPLDGEAGRERFEERARALFFSRLLFDALALAVILVPAWSRELGVSLPTGLYAYLFLLTWHVVAYTLVNSRFARPIVFISLCMDLLALVYLMGKTGGLHSPVMQGQLLYTVFFAMLFPSPLAILPPLLTLPILAKIQQILGTQVAQRDLLLLLWNSGLNSVIVLVVVYMDQKQQSYLRNLVRLQDVERTSAVASERSRIARELHDGLGSVLSGLLFQAEYLQAKIVGGEAGDPVGLSEELGEIKQAAQEGIEELRGAVSLMRDNFDLTDTLDTYCRSWSDRNRVELTWQTTGISPSVSPDVSWCCFRILQEALANVVRHAEAAHVSVRLSLEAEGVSLTISDDGKGFDPAVRRQGHFGIANMEVRAKQCHGEVMVHSEPGRGTQVLLKLPLVCE